MDFAFVDTSALVKLYVRESGSAAMWDLARQVPMAVSELAWAESFATFARRGREGFADPEVLASVGARFEQDWEGFLVVDPAAARQLVTVLVARHPLRGADAVHLASALLLAREGLRIRFACADLRLLGAAVAEGLDAVHPV